MDNSDSTTNNMEQQQQQQHRSDQQAGSSDATGALHSAQRQQMLDTVVRSRNNSRPPSPAPAVAMAAATAAAASPQSSDASSMVEQDDDFLPMPSSLRKVSFRNQQLSVDEIAHLLTEAFFTASNIPASFRSFPIQRVGIELDLGSNEIAGGLECLQPLIAGRIPLHTFKAESNRINDLTLLSSFAPTLQIVSVRHNALADLSHVFNHCVSLHTLDLGFNQIQSLASSGLGFCPNLTSLKLNSNRLKVLDDLHNHPKLVALDLRHNLLQDLDHTLEVLASMASLARLGILDANPMIKTAGGKAEARAKINAALPHLATIDDEPARAPAAAVVAAPVAKRAASPAAKRPASPNLGPRGPSPVPPHAVAHRSRPPSPAATASRVSPVPPSGPTAEATAAFASAPALRNTTGFAPVAATVPGSPTVRSQADPVTLSLTRELMQLNQQLLHTSNELTKSEAKRMELSRIARDQEQKQEKTLSATSAAAAPAATAAGASRLDDMKTLLLDRAHRRRMSGSGSVTPALFAAAGGGGASTPGGSVLSAHDFLNGSPAEAAPVIDPPVRGGGATSSGPFTSLVDAIDTIVAKSQRSSPRTSRSASNADETGFRAPMVTVPSDDASSPKSHLQLLSESEEFTVKNALSASTAQLNQPHPGLVRASSPLRTKLEEHRAAALSATLGHATRARLPSSGSGSQTYSPPTLANLPSADSPVHQRWQHPTRGSGDSTGADGRGEGGDAHNRVASDASSIADSELGEWNAEAAAAQLSPKHRVAASPSRMAPPGGPSYTELKVEILLLRKKGAAQQTRFQSLQATCEQQEGMLLEQKRCADVREGLMIAQGVLRTKLRTILQRRLRLWSSFARAATQRRLHAFHLVLQRRMLSDAHCSHENLSHAWDGWRSFVTHSNVAALKRQWSAEWEADLAKNQRAHACALISSMVRSSRESARRFALQQSLTRWRSFAHFASLRAFTESELRAQAEDKQVLIALVLQHKTALEAEQKTHAELRVSAEVAAAETAGRLSRLEKESTTNAALVRSLDQQNESLTRVCNLKVERTLARSRATVLITDGITRATRMKISASWRRWLHAVRLRHATLAAQLAAQPASEQRVPHLSAPDSPSGSSVAASSSTVDAPAPSQPNMAQNGHHARSTTSGSDSARSLPPSMGGAGAGAGVGGQSLTASQEAFLQYQHADHARELGPPSMPQSSPSARLAPAPPDYRHNMLSHQPPQPHPPHLQSHYTSSSPYSEPSRSRASSSAYAQYAAEEPMEDVDEALRHAQETKRRLESETLEIARKIADARFRTSNYTMHSQQQQQSQQQQPSTAQWQSSHAGFPARSPSSSFGPALHAARSTPMHPAHSPRTAARFGSPSPAGPSSRSKPAPPPADINGFYSAHLLQAKKY